MNIQTKPKSIRAAFRSGCHFTHGIISSLVMLVMAAMAVNASAAALTVSMMPSYSQNLTYANAAINQGIQVWGRVSGGSGTYTTYTLDFGDGTAAATGTVNNGFTSFQIGGPDFIQAMHTYTTGGSKTVTLTVSDNAGATASRSAVIRVLLAPTHDENVNMAIEKGLIYLYRNQSRYTTAGNVVTQWGSGGEYGNGASGAALMSFAENGHLYTSNPVDYVYAETVKRGCGHLVTKGRNMAITAQPDGNPDSNGNGRGIYYDDAQSYPHGFITMGLTNAFPDAAAAQAATIPAGLWVGGGTAPATYYDFVRDTLDQLSYNQGNAAPYKGWHYGMNTDNSGGGGYDGSTHQWPTIAILTAKERWGVIPPAWVVTNAVNTFIAGSDTNAASAFFVGIGYSGPNHWNNCAKTGGGLVGYYLGNKKVSAGDANAVSALGFIRNFYSSSTATGSGAQGGGWFGEFYAMFGMKKGLTLHDVTTFTTPDGKTQDWYKAFSGWLLGNSTVVDSSTTGGVAPGPPLTVSPATISSITFETLETCGSGTYTFFLNGVSLGSTPSNPTGGCVCGTPLTTFTVSNAGLLANWIGGAANNNLSFTFSGGVYISWVRAKVTSGGSSSHPVYLFDAPGGAVGERDFCNAGYTYFNSTTGSNNNLFGGSPDPFASGGALGAAFRNASNAFGQLSDGSWNTTQWPIGAVSSVPLMTAHAILILTKAVTIPLPVAVILPVGDQSSRFPAPFTLDGSTSYHQNPAIPLVEYLWDLDASNGVNFTTPDATGPTPTVNPGWNTTGDRTVTLQVKDNQNPALTATTTIVIHVTANDVAPTALPMPPSQVPQIYTGTLGSTIVLDGSASFDVDGDTIESYSWDLNGDGLYGTAADIALDTSGNNASANTASVVYTNPNNSQVGLKVCSTPRNAQGVAIGPQKCGVSARPVDVYASITDLYVSSLSVTDLVPTVRADVNVTLASKPGSNAQTNVVVRFYNGNPLAGGVQIGGSYTVNIPGGAAGGSVALPTIDNLALGGATTLWAFVDANNLVVEYNEVNNTANTSVSNRPPVAVAQDVTVNADDHCQGAVTAAQVNNGSSDPDGNALTFTLAPAGPFSLGSTPVTLSVSDGFITTTATANVIVLDVTPPTLAGQGAGSTIECPAVPSFTAPTATDNCDTAPVVAEVSDVSTPGACAGSYSRTKTWKATDAAGNESATVSQTIVVADTMAPTLGAAGANATIECPAVPDFTAPTATDNCDANPAVTEVGDVTIPGTCAGSYTRTKTWKAKDCTGNESGTVSQTIIVSDTTAPTLAGQGADGTIECPAVPVFTAPGASDACDPNPTVTEVDDVTTPGACAGSYTRTKTWVATDCGGNRSVAVSQTITVTDTTAPAIAGQGADATIESPAVPVFTAPGSTDNCDANPTVSVVSDVSTPGACDGAYSRTVTWKATDCSGHDSVTVSQTIIVADTAAPTLAGQGADATIECPTAPVFTAPRAQDANDAAPVVTEVSDVTTPGGCAGTYSRTKTWTAKDCTGNVSAAVTQTITVVDTTRPTLAGQGANATIECPAVPVFTAPGASDACDAAPTVTEVGDVTTPGTCPGSYTRTKTWTATDCTGNVSAPVSQSITVVDTTSPTISAAGANATIECPAVPSFTAPTAADACDGNPTVTEVSDVTIPGSCPGSYVRTKTWVASDCGGHQSGTVSQTITVVDTTNPTITCPASITVVNDPGVCGARVIYDVPVGSDNCSTVNTVQTAGLPSRAIFPVGQTVNTYTVTDCTGLTATCSFTVTVNDTQNPTIVCPPNKLVVSDSGSCTKSVALGTPVITDNCPGAVITNNHPSAVYPVGVTTVVWTVTDASGNTATCNQTVTVLSSISPTMSGFLPPLAGQPVGNKINRGQVVPHKLKLAGCSGQTISSGVTVYLKVQGIDSATGNVFQDVVEDAQGVGTDGVGTSDGIMRLTGGQYHFNLDTGNFSDPNTLAGSRYYRSTVTVVDNATLMVLGTISINLETAAR